MDSPFLLEYQKLVQQITLREEFRSEENKNQLNSYKSKLYGLKQFF